MQAAREFDAYFRSVIAERRIEPRGDILSALVEAEDEGERLTERETLNMLRLLIIAGNETNTNLIGTGMLALLRNPDQLRRAARRPRPHPVGPSKSCCATTRRPKCFFRRALMPTAR